MKENLIQYVNLLFAGVPGSEDIRQEILQNTLDRYDDLTAQGKSPEAAYRLAIAGIGDISEILGSPGDVTPPPAPGESPKSTDTPLKKLVRAMAVGLYILSPLPLFILSSFSGLETIGLCGTLAIVAAATVMMILAARREDPREKNKRGEKSKLQKCIDSLVWALAIALYFLVSFSTNAWHITWLIFLIAGALEGLIDACFDLKEACRYEN